MGFEKQQRYSLSWRILPWLSSSGDINNHQDTPPSFQRRTQDSVIAPSALDQPNGQVVLTVTGTLSETNQNAPDELDEGFFDFHKRDVGRAGAFDIGRLEALGTISVMVSYHKWPAKVRLEVSDVSAFGTN